MSFSYGRSEMLNVQTFSSRGNARLLEPGVLVTDVTACQ